MKYTPQPHACSQTTRIYIREKPTSYIYLAYLLILHHAPSSKQNLLHIYMTISIFIIANIRTCEKIFTQIALTFYIQQYEINFTLMAKKNYLQCSQVLHPNDSHIIQRTGGAVYNSGEQKLNRPNYSPTRTSVINTNTRITALIAIEFSFSQSNSKIKSHAFNIIQCTGSAKNLATPL